MCRTAIFALLLLLLSGCQEQGVESPAGGKVYPNAAYLRHFGQPPQVQQGYAYAQVGYLPVAGGSGKVAAIPLYLFGKERQQEKVIGQLFSEQLQGASRSNLLPLSRLGVRLQQLQQQGKTLTLNLETIGSSVAEQAGIDRALAETALQFEGVERVKINYDGRPSPRQPEDGYRPQPELIAPLGPPVLLDVAGIWEAGAKAPEELVIGFDRPVTVERFALLDGTGAKVAGDYFSSIFNMAVVLHPEHPEAFREGMPLQVEWQVVDPLGRKNAGTDRMKLLRRQH